MDIRTKGGENERGKANEEKGLFIPSRPEQRRAYKRVSPCRGDLQPSHIDLARRKSDVHS